MNFSVFKKISYLFNLLWSKKKITTVKPYSKFGHFLTSFDTDDTMYDDVSTAVNLCDEALKIAKQRIVLIDRISKIDLELIELENYSKLSSDESDRLRMLVTGYSSLREERNRLRYQLTDFDKDVDRMSELEEDAINAIPKIQDAEKYQRILKHDLGHLHGEKTQLEYEREMVESGLNFISKFAIAMVVMFGFIAVYLGYTYMLDSDSIFYPTTILILLAILIVSILYVFRRKLTSELKLNIRKQNRCVELINKKSVVMVYYTNFLRYEYKKYKVNNLQMLKSTLKDYGNYKHVALRIDSIRNIIYEAENEIENFLRKKNLNNYKFSVDQFVKTVNINDKLEYYKDLFEKRRSMEENLNQMDVNHERIWDVLFEISARDTTEEKIIDRIVQAYFDEVNRVLMNEKADPSTNLRQIDETPEEDNSENDLSSKIAEIKKMSAV